jgi:hypothetical protein
MAAGAAVVMYDAAGMGPLVTTYELDRLRALNFGIRGLRNQVSIDALEREIARYDADDATQVSHRIRSVAGRDSVIDEIISIYKEAIEEFNNTELDPAADERAAAEYLRLLSARLKENDVLRGERDWIKHLSEQRTDALAKQLAEKDAQLTSITRTLGWRLLSRYGPLKHRVVIPAYRRLQKLMGGDS